MPGQKVVREVSTGGALPWIPTIFSVLGAVLFLIATRKPSISP